LLQIIYTYLPFFLLTLLQPSHNFFTDDLTFIPLVCVVGWTLKFAKSAVKLCDWSAGRANEVRLQVCIERAVEVVRSVEARSVLRRGRRRVHGSIVDDVDSIAIELRGICLGKANCGGFDVDVAGYKMSMLD
jgi:hypothetical protein